MRGRHNHGYTAREAVQSPRGGVIYEAAGTGFMRLFIASGIFHPESGGPATYLHGLLPEVQAAGHQVRLLTFGDPTPSDSSGYGYPVQRIPRGPLPLRPLAYARYGRAARPLLAWAEVVYAHSQGLPLPRQPQKAQPRKARAIKVVGDLAWERAIRLKLIPPTTDVDAFQAASYGPLVERFKARRAAYVRSMDRVIVPSQYLKQMVIGWGVPADRVRVIYNALSPGAADRSAQSQAEARQSLGLEDGPLLLTVARLRAWKGIGPLIRAVAATAGVRLLVAGDGPLRPALEQVAVEAKAADRVTFLGRVPHQQVAVLMRAADYTALYSGYEGLSHTLLESLQAGTPVIASDKGGNPEVVLPDVNGLLVPYPDLDALTAAVQAAIRPGVRERLAAGTSQGMDRFAWDRLVRETLACLEEMV